MPLDPEVRRFLDRLAVSAARQSATLSVRERREALEQLLGFTSLRDPVTAVEDRTIPGPGGGLPIRIYTPQHGGTPPSPGLVYFHGGGFVAGSLDSFDGICRSLANASRFRVVSVGYRLAPEAPFPAAVEDACFATRWISSHASELGIDPRRLGICGDSAGATLAAVVCQTAAAEEIPPLAGQLLLCPILDYAAETVSRRDFAEGYFLDHGTLEHDLRHYLRGEGDVTDPRVSPLRAVRLEGQPPTCIHTAEFDPVRDEGEAYADRLQAAGVRASCRRHPGMIHLFYGMGALVPYSGAAYLQIAADLRSVFACGPSE